MYSAVATDDLILLRERRRRVSSAHADTPTFRGAAKEIQSIRASCEFLLSGPYETGKTFAVLYLLDTLLRIFPNSRAAILRKVRLWLNSTALETWRTVIALRGGVTVYGGERPEWYDYKNGSRVYIGGLDNPGNSLSGERDFIYINQAEELNVEDWETITTRATGRAAHAIVDGMPIGMVVGDCNPGPADHWILRRPQLELHESRHEDNPTLYDDTGELTARGVQTMGRLDALTGVRYQRGRMGRWVGAEGAYYTQLDEARHVVTMPERVGWPVWAGLDYGFSHPLSFGVYTADPFDNVYCIGYHSAHKWYIPQHCDAMDSLLDNLGINKVGLRIVAGHDCWNAGKDDPETIADKFGKRGYTLERAVISRVIGARNIGERLGNPECTPPIPSSLFFVEQARPIFDTLTRMVHDPRNAEDVLKVDADADGRGGDDDYDSLRYALMARARLVSVHTPPRTPNRFKEGF